jgi:hypothetical protein
MSDPVGNDVRIGGATTSNPIEIGRDPLHRPPIDAE